MNENLKNEIEFELTKNITNGICASGANISRMKHLLRKKYVSKKDMRKALELQEKYILKIQESKDAILQKLK